MNKPTFTKGPWHCGQGNGEGSIFADNGGRVTFSKKGTALHPICHIQNSFEENEDRANARLIASAPEMHALLVRLAHDDLGEDDFGGMVSVQTDMLIMDARELLAKVEGEK